MATTSRPTERERNGAPNAGVIHEARVRSVRRRRIHGMGAVVGAVVAVGAWLVAPPPRGRMHPARPVHPPAADQTGGRRGAPYLAPFLTGGGYGWCLIIVHGGGCPTMLTDPATTVAVDDPGQSREASILVVLAPRVANVLVDHHRGQIATLARLPYGMRLARVAFPPGSSILFRARSLSPIDQAGRPVGSAEPLTNSPESPLQARWWQAPESPPPGPGTIHAQGIPGLTAQWGHSATAIKPFPAPILGRAFFTCLDAEYTLHGWPLKVALLLDARHPATRIFPVPGMHPVAGSPGIYSAAGGWNVELTIERAGNAWLVVSGGSGLRQRAEVLRHLRAHIA